MGYRSDIKIITTKEGWEKLKQAEREARPNPEWGLYLTDERTSPLCGGKYVLFEIDSVKWYEGRDPQVDAIMRTLRNLADEHIPYHYSRLGESWEDIEYDNNDEWPTYKDMPRLELRREMRVEY